MTVIIKDFFATSSPGHPENYFSTSSRTGALSNTDIKGVDFTPEQNNTTYLSTVPYNADPTIGRLSFIWNLSNVKNITVLTLERTASDATNIVEIAFSLDGVNYTVVAPESTDILVPQYGLIRPPNQAAYGGWQQTRGKKRYVRNTGATIGASYVRLTIKNGYNEPAQEIDYPHIQPLQIRIEYETNEGGGDFGDGANVYAVRNRVIGTFGSVNSTFIGNNNRNNPAQSLIVKLPINSGKCIKSIRGSIAEMKPSVNENDYANEILARVMVIQDFSKDERSTLFDPTHTSVHNPFTLSPQMATGLKLLPDLPREDILFDMFINRTGTFDFEFNCALEIPRDSSAIVVLTPVYAVKDGTALGRKATDFMNYYGGAGGYLLRTLNVEGNYTYNA